MFNLKKSTSFLLSKCNQKARELSLDSLKRFNLTPAQAVVLTCLFATDGLSQLELVNKTGKDRTTISGIINRLKMLGFVDRVSDPNDRRSTLIFTTEKARALMEELEVEGHQVNAELTKALTDEEKATLKALLTKIWKS